MKHMPGCGKKFQIFPAGGGKIFDVKEVSQRKSKGGAV